MKWDSSTAAIDLIMVGSQKVARPTMWAISRWMDNEVIDVHTMQFESVIEKNEIPRFVGRGIILEILNEVTEHSIAINFWDVISFPITVHCTNQHQCWFSKSVHRYWETVRLTEVDVLFNILLFFFSTTQILSQQQKLSVIFIKGLDSLGLFSAERLPNTQSG